MYGTTGIEKTSFLKHYLNQTKADFLVFGRDNTEFHEQNCVDLLQLEKFDIESLANKTIILDDAGAYKQLHTRVENLFRFGRHHNIQVFYFAHYCRYVFPVVGENYLKMLITLNKPDTFLESIEYTYSIKDITNWKQSHDQLYNGMREIETRSQKYKILNSKNEQVNDTKKQK